MLLALLFFTLSLSARADAPACDILYGKLNALDPKLGAAYERARTLDPDLVHGKTTPKWQDFDNLDKLLADLRGGKADVAAKGQSEELKKILADAAAAAKTDATLKSLGDAAPKLSAQTYQPTEYDLKALYQKKLWEIDRELPKDLKIPITHIPYDARRPALIEQARKIVAAQEKEYDEKLFATSGFADDASLQAALRAHSPEAKKLIDDLEEGNVEFAMRRPEGARWWTPKVGFQNQRVTGTSRGMFSPEYRDGVEAAMTSEKLSDYKKFDTELKPVYGYLKPSPTSTLEQSRDAQSYGADVYVFKKKAVGDRVTWTAGDSFGWANRTGSDKEAPVPQDWNAQFVPWKDRSLLAPHLLNQVKQEQGYTAGFGADSLWAPGLPVPVLPPEPAGMPKMPPLKAPVLPSGAPSFRGDYGAYKEAYDAYSASDAFKAYLAASAKYQEEYKAYRATVDAFRASPEYKAYLTSDAYKKYVEDTRAVSTFMASHPELSEGAQPHSVFQGSTLAPYKSVRTGGYVELQYWGPLTFKDLESFEFEENPPTGDFLQALLDNGVKIFDARSGKAVPWTPPK
jgi:hypothetical protein